MKRLMGYLKNYRRLVFLGPFFKLLESVCELANPIIVAHIIDVGIARQDIPYIIRFGLLILVINCLALGCAAISNKCAAITSVGVATHFRNDLFKQVTKFSHTELDKYGTASLINRLTNDINQVEDAVARVLRFILRGPFMLIGAFVLSLIINRKMSLIFLALVPIVVIVVVLYTKKTYPYYHQIRSKVDTISKITKENLSGTRVIRAFNKQDYEQTRFERSTEDYTKTTIHVSKFSSLLIPVIYTLVDLATIVVLLVGGVQVNIGNMSQGNIIALIDYVTIITISLLAISTQFIFLVRTSASLKRVNEVIDTQPTISSNTRRVTPGEYDALMQFVGVGFNYLQSKDEKSFIKDLNFSIMPGQTIGIIGGTGSGKTTLANLMVRFYDVTHGQILYKGKDIKDYPIEQLRHEISIVQQRSTLFSGSVRENMQIRNPKATDEEIINALKVSQAWEFVSEWPQALDYQIMAGGKNVSGGQMQRLTIARALIDKPEMVILDDSSSALDFLTESQLRHALIELNTTLVLISQRATSIKHADLIIVLDNGDVVGMGKHAQLLKDCEIYKEIYESQSK